MLFMIYIKNSMYSFSINIHKVINYNKLSQFNNIINLIETHKIYDNY